MRTILRLTVFAAAAAGCGNGQAVVPIVPVAGDAGAMAVVPSCLRDLLAACPAGGDCRSGVTDGGLQTLLCYAGGVQADQALTGSCSGGAVNALLVIDVRKPDGSPCYTYEDSMGFLCIGQAITWRDPSGAVVATQISGAESSTVTCAASGETFSCGVSTPGNLCSLGPIAPNQNCQPGGCP
jgi:hypothetical protein